MATLKVYTGASWVTTVAKVYDGATWKEKMSFHDGSSFQTLYPTGPSVSWNGQTISNVRFGGACQANWKADNDGSKYKSDNVGTYSFYKVWLTSGLNSEVWVERTITAGSLTLDTIGASRVIMTTDRQLGVTKTTSGFKTATVTVKFYDAASGGNLLATGTLNLQAEYSL